MKTQLARLFPLMLVNLLSSTDLHADIPPPGALACRTAQAGDTCEVDVRGMGTGEWGVCVQTSECGRWLPCEEPSVANLPDCVDDVYNGYARAAEDCLICKTDAGTAGSASPDPSAGGSTPAGSAKEPDESGCAIARPTVGPVRRPWCVSTLLGVLLLAFGRRLRR